MVDLHLHTNHSDGTDTVIELLEKAEQQKLEIISITDHDTVSAYKELEDSKIRNKFKGEIVVGAELKAIYNNHNIEILAYGIDSKKMKIYKCDNLQEKILEHFKKVADKYQIKYKTTLIDGFECQHSIFSEEQKAEIIELCQKHNKYMSGGSDYHAKNKPDVQMGTGKNNNVHVEKQFVENWIKLLPKI